MTDRPLQSTGFAEEALPHLDAVYRFALRLSGSTDAAEDLVQETYLRALRAWSQYVAGTSAKSWLFTICRNVFLRGEERARRHQEIVSGATQPSLPTGGEPEPAMWAAQRLDPEGDFLRSIVDEQILEAISALPEDYRTAVALSDMEGLSYAEIAELMDVPVGTVKSRLFRGRRLLQEALYEHAREIGIIGSTARSKAAG